MKQTKHKILSVFLSFCMIISCMAGISVTAYAVGKKAKITSSGGGGTGTVASSATLPVQYTVAQLMPFMSGATVNSASIASGNNVAYDSTTQTVTINDVGTFTMNVNYGNNWNLNLSVNVEEIVAVTSVSLNKTSLELEVDCTETLTATVSPNEVSDKTVTWTSSDTSVATVENGVVTAVAAGTANITATSNADSTISATCAVTVNAASPTVTITPTGAGTVDWAWDSEYPQDLILTAAANSGYEFDHWSYSYQPVTNAEWEDKTSTSDTLTIAYYNDKYVYYKNITAHFKATTVAASDIDISNGTVTVSTSAKTVTVTVDGNTVPADAYHIIYFTYEKIEGGETLNRVGTDFPTTAGTYIAAVVANENSGYTGENRSEPFSVSSGSGYTPVAPSYTPATTTTTTNTGKLDNTTDEKKNDNGASLESSNDELSKAVLTDADRAAMAKGEDVQVYLEVEEKEPTKADQQKAEEALAEIDADGEIVMYMDMNLFKKVGSSSPVQIHKVGDKVEVGFNVPEKFVNNDPDVQRTFYIGHIKDDGTVEIIRCEFDPETGIATFLTDSFSCFFLIFKDAPASADTSVEETDSGTDNGKEIDISDNTDNQVDHADETNPHTGVAFGGIAVLITAGAAMIVSKKRRK